MRFHSYAASAAISAASKSIYKFKLGCAIVYKNRIISIGYNKNKTHPKSNTDHNTIHAELDAIIKVWDEDLSDCFLYVCRIKKDNSFGLAKPCYWCMNLIREKNIRNVYHTDNNNRWIKLKI